MTAVERFKPTGERVLVQPIVAATQVGRVVIPDAHKEQRPAEAVVVAVGPRVALDTDGRGRPLSTGDRVLTNRFNGTDVHIGGRPYRLLAPEEILAVVTEARA